MSITLPDEADQWLAAYHERLAANDDYTEAASGWGVDFDGDFVLHVRPDDVYDGDPITFFLELEDGAVHGSRVVDSPEAVDHGFSISGPYSEWKRLIQGEVGIVDGVMSGDFDAGGSKLTALQFQEALVEMGETATNIDTDFEY
jgi:putative sterol carrier protein